MYRGSGGDHAQILHKTDVGGVSLNLASEEAVSREVERLHAKFSAQGIEYHGILVSEMLPKGLEMMIGANRDAAFGPLTVSGAGGVFVELLKDVAFNLGPVSIEEAKRSLRHLKYREMMEG